MKGREKNSKQRDDVSYMAGRRGLLALVALSLGLSAMAVPFSVEWYSRQLRPIPFDRHVSKLMRWINENDGYVNPQQAPKYNPIRGMQATAPLPTGEKLAEIPLKLCLSLQVIQEYEMEEQHETGTLGVATKIGRLSDLKTYHAPFAASLAAAYRRSKQPGNGWAQRFEPHLAFLFDDPTTYDGMLQLESPERLHQLRPSIEGEAAAQSRSFAETDFARIRNRLSRKETGGFSLNEFTRAILAITSRNFITRNKQTLSPYSDLYNHAADSNAKWSYDAVRDCFIIWTVRPIATGEEITVSYGDKSNAELLSLYGFTLPPNEEKCYTYRFSVSDAAFPKSESLRLVLDGKNEVFRFSTCQPRHASPFMRTWREHRSEWTKVLDARLKMYKQDEDFSVYRKALEEKLKATKGKSLDWWTKLPPNLQESAWDQNRRRMKLGEYICIMAHSQALQLHSGDLKADDAIALAKYVLSSMRDTSTITTPAVA